MGVRSWIFLRGLARERAHWGDFLERFARVFPRDRVVALDAPGCGSRRGEPVPSDVAGLLAGVRDLALRTAIAGPVHLFALSLGGVIACEWMAQHPSEIAGAVLLSSSLGGVSPPWQRMRPSALRALLRAAATQDETERERRVLEIVSARPDRAAAALPLWAEIARERPVRLSTAVAQALAAARHRPQPLTAPVVPCLVLGGEGDRLVDPRCAHALAGHLHAPVRVHPSAGHDLALDEPEWVLGEVQTWLAS